MPELQPSKCLICRTMGDNHVWLKYGTIANGVPLIIHLTLCDRHAETSGEELARVVAVRDRELRGGGRN